MYSYILRKMMEKKLIREYDSDMLAMELISPISLMVAVIDRQPEREEEISAVIRKHINHFTSEYGLAR